ncbi:MAG: hypothetical protein FJ267_13785 [Planctomycetes bacterium]|nr:hypothetical protein [Planctomycetota bacterium]
MKRRMNNPELFVLFMVIVGFLLAIPLWFMLGVDGLKLLGVSWGACFLPGLLALAVDGVCGRKWMSGLWPVLAGVIRLTSVLLVFVVGFQVLRRELMFQFGLLLGLVYLVTLLIETRLMVRDSSKQRVAE